jgi:predicted short-subunit dehydrogenase-like oxidoreductase (DUF2520 family)
MTVLRVTILGAGKVGRALAHALERRGHRVTLHGARGVLETLASGDQVSRAPRITDPLLVLAVRDPDLPKLARELVRRRCVSRRTVVLHVAGALGPEVLSPLDKHVAGVGQAHPLLAFAERPDGARVRRRSHSASLRWDDALLLIAGDPRAVAQAHKLGRALGMRPRHWSRIDRALYHAAAVVLGNGAVALAAAAATLLRAAGAPERDIPRALAPLLHSVADNIGTLGLPSALTGPVRRGDVATVTRHIQRIARKAPQILPLYVAVERAQLPLAAALGEASPPALAELAELFQRSAAKVPRTRVSKQSSRRQTSRARSRQRW